MRRGRIMVTAIMAGVVLAVVATALALCRAGAVEPAGPEPLATVYDSPGEGMRVLPQADGPLYDAPPDVEQTVVCDRDNRMYILLRTPQGGIAITPYLDRDGSQRVMPRP